MILFAEQKRKGSGVHIASPHSYGLPFNVMSLQDKNNLGGAQV